MSFIKSALAIGLSLLASQSVANVIPDLNLGYPGLKQTEIHRPITEGADLYQITRGHSSIMDEYVLSSGALPEKVAFDLSERLIKEGYRVSVELPPEFTPETLSPGLIVRLRHVFDSERDAIKTAERLKKHEISMAVRYSAEDGYGTTGPFHISVLRVDLDRFRGDIRPVLGQGGVPGVETVSEMVKRHDALVGINGGFFVFDKQLGTEGAPAGLMVLDGLIVKEAINQRPGLIIDNRGATPKVTISHALETQMTLSKGEHSYTIDGLNREAGKIFNCGGVGDWPLNTPVHDFLCTDASEIIVFDQHFGGLTPQGLGLEMVVDANGVVTHIHPELGQAMAHNTRHVQVTGELATLFKERFAVGDTLSFSQQLFSEGVPVSLEEGIFALNGGPTLLDDYQEHLSDRANQGWFTRFQAAISDRFVDAKDHAVTGQQAVKERIGFYNGWALRRHPRTAVGVTEDNVLYAVVVYGRNPEYSAGASISDLRRIMDSLNVQDAVNLDGGGSSVMVNGSARTGKTSDASGERAVSDGLLFFS